MLSALIPSELSYPAMPLAGQLAHQRFVHSGPLVLGTTSLKLLTPAADRDQPVSRMYYNKCNFPIITNGMDYTTLQYFLEHRHIIWRFFAKSIYKKISLYGANKLFFYVS